MQAGKGNIICGNMAVVSCIAKVMQAAETVTIPTSSEKQLVAVERELADLKVKCAEDQKAFLRELSACKVKFAEDKSQAKQEAEAPPIAAPTSKAAPPSVKARPASIVNPGPHALTPSSTPNGAPKARIIHIEAAVAPTLDGKSTVYSSVSTGADGGLATRLALLNAKEGAAIAPSQETLNLRQAGEAIGRRSTLSAGGTGSQPLADGVTGVLPTMSLRERMASLTGGKPKPFDDEANQRASTLKYRNLIPSVT